MTRFLRACAVRARLAAALVPFSAGAQDTTYRGIKLGGAYDPLHDKMAIVVLPVAGAFGDSVRAIIQRDLDFSDRFTVIAVDSADPNALRSRDRCRTQLSGLRSHWRGGRGPDHRGGHGPARRTARRRRRRRS